MAKKTPDQKASITPKMRAFLDAYAQTGSIPAAAQAVGIDRSTHRKSYMKNPAYAAEFEDAKHDVKDMLETEVIRRATRGTDRPVFHKGKQVGTIREYSDLLLIFYLKAMDPQKYREHHQHQHTGEIKHIKMYAQEAPVGRV